MAEETEKESLLEKIRRFSDSKIAKILFWITAFILALFVSIAIPFLSIGSYKIDFKAKVDPAIMNGILTGTAIIFGFVTYDLRKLGKTLTERVVLPIPLLVLLIYTVDYYFADAVTLGYPTVNTLITSVVTFFFTILYYFLILLFLKDLSMWHRDQ